MNTDLERILRNAELLEARLAAADPRDDVAWLAAKDVVAVVKKILETT